MWLLYSGDFKNLSQKQYFFYYAWVRENNNETCVVWVNLIFTCFGELQVEYYSFKNLKVKFNKRGINFCKILNKLKLLKTLFSAKNILFVIVTSFFNYMAVNILKTFQSMSKQLNISHDQFFYCIRTYLFLPDERLWYVVSTRNNYKFCASDNF